MSEHRFRKIPTNILSADLSDSSLINVNSHHFNASENQRTLRIGDLRAIPTHNQVVAVFEMLIGLSNRSVCTNVRMFMCTCVFVCVCACVRARVCARV